MQARMMLFGMVWLLFGGHTLRSDDAIVPRYSTGRQEVVVESIRRIWSEAPHNAFPDLQYFQGRWIVSFREGTEHGHAGFGRIRLLSGAEGGPWRSVAMFDGFGDYRHAALSVTPDDRILAIAKFNHYRSAGADDEKPFDAVDQQGETHKVVVQDEEDRAAFSNDGVHWTTMEPMLGTEKKAWFHGGVQWHDGVGYAVDRQNGGRSTLYRTKDARNFEAITAKVPAGNESRYGFLPDDTMIAFFRNGSLATSRPPYEEWTLNATNKEGNHSHAGPGILALPSGDVWTACRYRLEAGQGFELSTKKEEADGTVMFKLVGERLVPKLLIPGGGDRGYNGLAWHDGFIWMVYNAPSKETNKSSIYLAKIKPLK